MEIDAAQKAYPAKLSSHKEELMINPLHISSRYASDCVKVSGSGLLVLGVATPKKIFTSTPVNAKSRVSAVESGVAAYCHSRA